MSEEKKETRKPIGIGKLGTDFTPKKKFRFAFTLKETVKEPVVCPLTQIVHYRDKEIEYPGFLVRMTTFFSKELQGVPGVKIELEEEFAWIKFKNEAVKFKCWLSDLSKDHFRFLMEQTQLVNAEFETKAKLAKKWQGILTLLDGCGQPVETWTLHGIIPWSAKFSDIDYTSCEETEVEILLIYSKIAFQSHIEIKPAELCVPKNEYFKIQTSYGNRIELKDLPEIPPEGIQIRPITGSVYLDDEVKPAE